MPAAKSMGDIASANIKVSRKARYALKEAKRDRETLSDVILRLAKFAEFAGMEHEI